MIYKFSISQIIDSLLETPSCGFKEGIFHINSGDFSKAMRSLTGTLEKTAGDMTIDRLLELDTSEHEKKYSGEMLRALSIFLSYINPAVALAYDMASDESPLRSYEMEDDEHLEQSMLKDEESENRLFKNYLQLKLYVLREIVALAKAQNLDLKRLLLNASDCGMEEYGASCSLIEFLDEIEADIRNKAVGTKSSLGEFLIKLNAVSRADILSDKDKEDEFYCAAEQIWGSIGEVRSAYIGEVVTPLLDGTIEMPNKFALLRQVLINNYDQSPWWRVHDRYLKYMSKKARSET